jgi:hypothetical protein
MIVDEFWLEYLIRVHIIPSLPDFFTAWFTKKLHPVIPQLVYFNQLSQLCESIEAAPHRNERLLETVKGLLKSGECIVMVALHVLRRGMVCSNLNNLSADIHLFSCTRSHQDTGNKTASRWNSSYSIYPSRGEFQ